MSDEDVKDIPAEISLLEHHVGDLVSRLRTCREENELLRSELVSLQNVLRACRLPETGSTPLAGPDAGLPYAEKLRVKQKLVLILQKIELELRNSKSL